jgi:hypothetical protein
MLEYAMCLGLDMVRASESAFTNQDWRMDLQSAVKGLNYRSFQSVLAAKLLRYGLKWPAVDLSVFPQSGQNPANAGAFGSFHWFSLLVPLLNLLFEKVAHP